MENEIGKKGSPSMSRNSSIGYYYQRRSEGVPFKWEMQPGTPINTQTTEMIPPLSPPPAMLSLGFPKPSISVEEPKHSVFPAKLKLRKWKYIRCRKYFSRLANKMVLPSIRLYPEKRGISLAEIDGEIQRDEEIAEGDGEDIGARDGVGTGELESGFGRITTSNPSPGKERLMGSSRSAALKAVEETRTEASQPLGKQSLASFVSSSPTISILPSLSIPRSSMESSLSINLLSRRTKKPELYVECALYIDGVPLVFPMRTRAQTTKACKELGSLSGDERQSFFAVWSGVMFRKQSITSLQHIAEEQEIRRHVVLTKPYSLEDEKDSEHTAANVIRRILSLLKNVRPGSDLTNFQLPPQLNLPKSQLQCYGEMIYSFGGHDLLGECSRRDLPIERLKSVVAWNISKLRPVLFGQAPYNPVLGETHHVSSGHINVLIEQVSHHPPVSALQATHEEENIDVMWVQHFIPKFRGAYVELEVKGKRVMKLQSRKETYDMNQPRLVIRLVPVPRADWAGKMKIKCPETDLEAELHLVSDSFIERFRGNNNRAVKGKISESSSGSKLYDIFGNWDRTISAKNLKTGEVEVLYNANESISGLKPPTVKNLKEVMESESAMVWSEVSEGILNKDWERAREAKKAVEEKQRKSLKQREVSGESWVPQHFSVVKNGKDWDCTPLQPTVPRAPLVITEAHEDIMN
uniref:Uncharacterized protein n=2 Tax=Brassica oleracea var. oleracea TaxID=109376 RepID=A0A0D3A6E9_BRAOL